MKNNKSEKINKQETKHSSCQSPALRKENEIEKEIEELEKELSELIRDLKIFISKENYFLFKERIGKLLDKAFNQGSLSKQKDVLKILDEIENPYPEDIFPELTKTDLEYLNYIFNKSHLTLDRVSASLMRRARDNLIEELKSRIEQK